MTALRQQGINALKAGNKSQARQLLQMAVEENPQDAQAWLWLSGAVETDQERLKCLKTVIQLDPDNTVAAKGIAKLVASGKLDPQIRQPEMPPVRPPQEQPAPTPPPTRSAADSTPRVLFETRPSFVPFVIGSGLILVIFGFLGGGISNFLGDNSTSRLIFWGLLCLLAIMTIWQLFLAFLRSVVTRYTLTTRYLMVQSGVFSRSKKTIPLSKIQDVSTHQLFVLRPFGVGDVIVESAGEYGQTKLRALAHCHQRSEQILKLVHKNA